MKAKVYDLTGKEKTSIDLGKCFSVELREDVIAKILEAKKQHQSYGASPVAGMQSSAAGKIVHRRGVWKSQYKRGISRIPRKIMSRRGSQFNWVGAFVPQAIGGRKAHPPKAIKNWEKTINKKEMKLATCSALSATVNPKEIAKRYSRLEEKDIKVPLVIESKDNIKVKELLSVIKQILGDKVYEVALRTRKVRAGIGKLRGRKYKSTAGLLLVIGKQEKIKTKAFEVKNTNELSIVDLAKGGPGRLTVYTEKAIQELNEKYDKKSK